MPLPPDFWAATSAIAASIQTIIVFFAVVYAILQTRQIRRQVKTDEITARKEQLQRVNELVLDRTNEDLAMAIGEDRSTAFASIILNMFTTWWEFNQQGLISKDEWNGYVAAMSDIMKSELMRKHWLGDSTMPGRVGMAHSGYYSSEFANFIDRLAK
jgi:hypothetical protein